MSDISFRRRRESDLYGHGGAAWQQGGGSSQPPSSELEATEKKIANFGITILVVACVAVISWLEFVVDCHNPAPAVYVFTPTGNPSETVMFAFKGGRMRIAVYEGKNLVELTEFKAGYEWWKHLVGPVYWKSGSWWGFRINTGGGEIATQHSEKLRYVRRGNWDGFFSTRTSKDSKIVFRDGGIDFEQGTAESVASEKADRILNSRWDKWTDLLDKEGRRE